MAELKPAKSSKKFSIKNYLITGLLVWMPIAVTFWVLSIIVTTLDDTIRLLPAMWQPKALFGWEVPGLGVLLTVIVLLITGMFAANVLGKKMILVWDAILGRIPIVKSIYSSVKQVSESLFSDSRQSFKTPLLVQFPHQGAWTVAFVTGTVPPQIGLCLTPRAPGQAAEEYVTVYVPTTPNPTSGYYIMVKKSDTRDINMSVDEALKYVISLGMVVPGAEGDAPLGPVSTEGVAAATAVGERSQESKDAVSTPMTQRDEK